MLSRRSFLSLAAVAVVGCVGPSDDRRARDRDRPVRDRDEGWELLGRRDVGGGRTDRDTIEVGRSEGRFSKLRIVVQGAPVEVYDMRVTFGDGSVFDPPLRHTFQEGSASRVIDLPGDRRAIRRIDFVYRNADRREGRATVSVFGGR